MLLPATIEFDKSVDFVKAVHRKHFGRHMRSLGIQILPVGIIGAFGVLGNSIKNRPTWGFWLLILFSVWPFLHWFIYWLATGQIRSNAVPALITVHIERDLFTVTTGHIVSKVDWARVQTIWKFSDLFMLFWDKRNSLDNSLAIPSQALSKDLLLFIEKKVRDNGGRIV